MKPIYLEIDEEITSVVERIGQLEETNIAVVVPKNSTLFQSLVNLKLLARQAKNLKKEVVIISSNKVGARLAKQVGLDTYATIGSVATSPEKSSGSAPPDNSTSDTLPDGTPIHRYNGAVSAGAESVVKGDSQKVETKNWSLTAMKKTTQVNLLDQTQL